MVGTETAGWPEYPGLDVWLPLAVLDGLAGEFAELIGEDLAGAWIRAVGDPDAAPRESQVQLAWLADGCLLFAVVAGYAVGTDTAVRDCPLRLVGHRRVELGELIEVDRGPNGQVPASVIHNPWTIVS